MEKPGGGQTGKADGADGAQRAAYALCLRGGGPWAENAVGGAAPAGGVRGEKTAPGRRDPGGAAAGFPLFGGAGKIRRAPGLHPAAAPGPGGGDRGLAPGAAGLDCRRPGGGGGRAADGRTGADGDGALPALPLRAAGPALRRRGIEPPTAAGIRRVAAAGSVQGTAGGGGGPGAVRGAAGPEQEKSCGAGTV